MSNKIQPRTSSAPVPAVSLNGGGWKHSAAEEGPPAARRGAEGHQEEPSSDARDLRLLRELSRDLREQLCQSVREAVREELQSMPQASRAALGVEGSAADAGGRTHGLHQTTDIKDMARRNNLATSHATADEGADMACFVTSHKVANRGLSARFDLVADPLARIFPPEHSCFAPWYRLASWFLSLKEPERTGFMARLSRSWTFECFSILGISLNCVFMIVSADEAVRNYWRPDTTPTLKIVELLFLFWFGIELGIQMYVHGRYFYISPSWKSRVLDTFLIVFQTWSVAGNYALISSQHNLSFFRAVKMLRVLRVVRALNAMHHFKQLHVMLLAIQTSLATLVWSMLMVAGIMWMFSLLFVQVTTVHFQELSEKLGVDELNSDALSADEANLITNFASVGTTMVCLFMASTGGDDWSIYYRALSSVGFVYQLVFLTFICLMQFAVLNIVTGIFVETAMTQMAQDPEDAAIEALKKRQQQEQHLLTVCREADTNQNGNLTRQEFLNAIRGGKLSGFLDSLGFRHHDLIDFFCILESASPNEKVDVDVFVSGCMQLAGGATCFSVKALLMEVQTIRDAIADLRLALFRAQSEPATPESKAREPLELDPV